MARVEPTRWVVEEGDTRAVVEVDEAGGVASTTDPNQLEPWDERFDNPDDALAWTQAMVDRVEAATSDFVNARASYSARVIEARQAANAKVRDSDTTRG